MEPLLAAGKNGRITKCSAEDVVYRCEGRRYTTLRLQPLGPSVHGRYKSPRPHDKNKINGYINS